MNDHDDNIERRSLSTVAELRIHEDGGESPKIVGYAAVFNSLSEELFGPAGRFREIVRPGAFTDSLAGGADVRALVDHHPSKILGRISAGTLDVAEDKRGLRFEIVPPDTTAGRDIMESIRRGDVSGTSFQFDIIEDDWETVKGKLRRDLIKADLIDVSVVTFPAYPKTTVAMRSLAAWLVTQKPRGVPVPILRRRLELEAIR